MRVDNLLEWLITGVYHHKTKGMTSIAIFLIPAHHVITPHSGGDTIPH